MQKCPSPFPASLIAGALDAFWHIFDLFCGHLPGVGWDQARAWRDFSISKILVRIRLISSRSPISKHETWKKISRSRLEPWDIDKKISFSSRNSRFREQNSRSRLEPWDWERQNLEKWKDSISFIGAVCKVLIDPVARFLLPFSHSECKWLETGLNFDCQVGVWRL